MIEEGNGPAVTSVADLHGCGALMPVADVGVRGRNLES